jgi:hypothetical protein
VRVRNVDSNISGAGESDGIRVREDASAATEVLSQKYIGLAPPVSSRGSYRLPIMYGAVKGQRKM